MRTLGMGIHDGIPEAAYHADPCGVPSLSSSIAHVLCSQSPRHAWTQHPRLNPDYQPEERTTFDLGTEAHALILRGVDVAHVVEADDWRPKSAREERDAARAVGKVPLLRKQYDRVLALVEAVREQLAQHHADPTPFTDGRPEQAVTWDEDGVACRALVDWLRDDRACIDDLKTTSRSARPDLYARSLYSTGGDIQAWFHSRGVEAVTGIRPRFRWVVVETFPPYALSVIEPGPDVLTLGMKKALYALRLWRQCLERDDWPGYPPDVATAVLPSWEEERWLAREAEEEAAA